MKQGKKSETGLRIASGSVEGIRANVSDNTLKAYKHATRKLESWLEGRALSDASLAEYVRFLHEQGKSQATINLALSAVKWMAEYRRIDPVAGAATERAVSTVREKGKGRGRRQVDGLTWDDVERVCAAAESADTVAGTRDAAMISLMSDCLLRISEVVAVDVEDVGEEGLRMAGGERGQEERGANLYICESTRRLIKRYRRKARIESDALFRRVRFQNHVTEERLGVKGAREAIQRWAAEAGIEGFISGHSLRVGSAVSLARAGASVVDMQTAGRWKSADMPAHYAKAELAERGAIARFKDGK
ncbi:MAG: tyrosine-type recombinase/integrase [Candidatus Poribacteria bacterium]|nr:tyrosine-type recombinase/integrase [Candidatus Poribacteria bacterium]